MSRWASARLLPVFAVLLLTTASLALVVPGLGPPIAQAQTTSFEVTSFEVSQIALAPTGGSVTVEVEAASTLAPLELDLRLHAPQGTVHRLPAIEANALSSSTVSAQAPVTIPGGTSGWWTIRIAGAETTGEDPQTLSATGVTTARVLVHPDVPLAGEEGGPVWSQPGGDPMHSGHTLAIGPEELPIERWAFRSQNGQPFHTPVVAEDGTILALTWSGDAYALDSEGQLRWVHRPNTGGISAFPPALNAAGHLIVGQDGQGFRALDGGGQVAWQRQIASPVAGPVTTEDGRTYVLEEPWTLVALDGQGRQLYSTALASPDGLANPVPQIPVPTQGPRLAVSADGQAIALSGDGIAVVNATGGVTDAFPCNCTPRSVALAPDLPIALVGGETQLVSISLKSGEIIWTTDQQGLAALTDIQGTIWAPPAMNWDRLLHVATEEGRLHSLTLDGAHRWNQGGFDPIRGQAVVDGQGHLFVSDCRRGLYARTADGTPMWTKEINWDTCGGLTTGLALTRSGGLLWASPDGELRMFGSNRLPVPAFNASWNGEAWSFDAQASQDPDGTPLTYAWTFGDGTAGRGVQVTHLYATSGTYTVTLTVSDGTSTATARQELVVDFPPRPVIVDESDGFHVKLNASTSTDPEGDRIRYNWTLGDEPAGNGSTLAFTAPSPRVHPVTLTVSDGNLARTTSYTALAPDPSAWASVTLALYDGSCPAGLCSFPETLNLVEDRLLKLLVVNGGTTTVTASIPFQAIPGGASQATIPPGEQATLHVNTGEPGTASLEIAPVNAPGSITRVPVDVRQAPAQVSWHLEAPAEAPRVNQLSRAGIVLEGTAAPAPVDLRISLRVDGQEITSRRVGLVPGEPVNTTVHLGFTPEATGPLSLSATVESLNTDRAVVTDPPEDGATASLTVGEQPLLSRIAQALPLGTTGWLSLLAFVVVAAGAAGGAVYLNRRRPGPEGTPPSTGASATGTAATADDATVAGSFMPRKVERFHIERVLGEGGFGTTYLARDTVLEREVVLKQIEHVGQGEARELLLHEARAAANLSHPNVVVVHDVIEENGKLLLVMEYVQGGTLQDLLSDGGVDPKEALSVFTDLLQGLSALHEAGVVHRDLKPSNILLTREAEAKITDFGVAARMGEPGALEGDTFVGTPRYMAPEQLAGDRPGPAADLYAAGAILYELLTGEHHLGLGNGQVPDAEELLERTSKLPAPGLEPALNAVLERALARAPEDRFESAEAFLQALRTTYREAS